MGNRILAHPRLPKWPACILTVPQREKAFFLREAASRIAPIGQKTRSARTPRVNVPIHNLPEMSTTSDFSSFGRRSSVFRQPRQILFTWHPMMAVKTLSTQERTARYLGVQSDKLQWEWSVLSHTKLPKRGQNSSFASLVWKAVLRCRMCKFYTADFQNSTAKRKENSLAKWIPLL